MNIQKYSPFNWFNDEDQQSAILPSAGRVNVSYPFSLLHQEIDRLFDDAFKGFGTPSLDFSGSEKNKGTMLRPNVDISESEKQYNVTVEIPGVNQDDVSIEVSNGVLAIRGEKKFEKEGKDKSFYRVESSYGSFQRVLSLPKDVDQNAIEAEFKNGVLNLTLPRKASSKPDVKRINVKKAA